MSGSTNESETTASASTNSANSASNRRVLRAELIIAALALITSACASVAAIVQTESTREQTTTIAKQLGASVWPYLTIDYSFSRKSVNLTITNQGLGPALIKTVDILIDDRPSTDLRAMLKIIDSHPNTTTSESDIGPGSVIRPSETFTLFQINDKHMPVPGPKSNFFKRIQLEVCYCSLLADCWLLKQHDSEPVHVAACGAPTKRLAF